MKYGIKPYELFRGAAKQLDRTLARGDKKWIDDSKFINEGMSRVELTRGGIKSMKIQGILVTDMLVAYKEKHAD